MDATQAPSALLGLLVQPTSSGASSTQESAKTMQKLLNEIDQATVDVEASLRTLEKIDTRHKQAATNRDRLTEGRTQIKRLTDRIADLQHQMERMTKKSDPTWPAKTFDRSKQDGLQSLSNLSNHLNLVDKRFQKALSPTYSQSSTPPTAASEEDNTKGLGALMRQLPFGSLSTTASTAVADPRELSSSTSNNSDEEEESDEEDDDVVSGQKQDAQNLSRPEEFRKKHSDETDQSDEEEENDSDDVIDNHLLLNELESRKLSGNYSQLSRNPHDQSRTPSPAPFNINRSLVQAHSTPSSSSSSSLPRKQIPNFRKPIVIPAMRQQEENDDNGTDFEENESEQGHTGSHEENGSIHEYEPTDYDDDDEPVVVSSTVQKLREGIYQPGTRFRVIHNFTGAQTGDLTIHVGEIIALVEQRPDDWWLFENPQTQLQGMVPINHIELESGSHGRRLRPQGEPITTASTFVDAFKMNNNIPSGFIASDLAPLMQKSEYKLSHTLIPKMTQSNFDFADLHWRYDTEQIHAQQVEYQKILTIKKCTKIPKIKKEQIRVLSRCVRLCLYDGYEIVSNICAIRVKLWETDRRSFTEDWSFADNNKNTFIDEQPEFLIRSNESDPTKHVCVLIELSQLCQPTTSEEKYEVGCGWMMISLVDDQLSGFRETKSFNELLHGGHIHQPNILLSSAYKNFRFEGLRGRIDRSKQARLQYSLESRESNVDILYDNLPVTSMIVPKNLVQSLVFYRNELAYQLQRRSQSSRPVDSIFLSTFNQILDQPDLVYILQVLYRRHRSSNVRRQRNEFIQIYERSIYPLLTYRLLPAYDFQNMSLMNQRRQLIQEMIDKQRPNNAKYQPDILAILLDPQLTDRWTPFTTNEICFSMQKHLYDFTS